MSSIYESEKLLAEYLLFHYASAEEVLPPGRVWPAGMASALEFPCRTVAHFGKKQVARGLDLGCAVGRSSFEMARHCDEVLGIDFSHAFIRAAEALRKGEVLAYHRLEEGTQRTELNACRPAGVAGGNLQFCQGDAMHLAADLGSFERVHAANLLCRLSEPQLLLERLPSLVRPGGELVLATPCTWLEEFTPPAHWPAEGTLAWLKASLHPSFSLAKELDEPFLIRETARKFQWSTALVTVWQRRND
ncbi:MAG: methyltransferase domain-containing protein [Verrucomicrobiota bacterium]